KMHNRTAPEVWWTHQQFALGRWTYNKLDDDHFKFLEKLPEQYVVDIAGCAPFRVVHGSPWDINKEVFPDKDPEALTRALAMIPEGILVFAHTHLPDVIYKDGKLALNPGSVSNNLNGDTRASYATLTWEGNNWQPLLHYIPYDHDEVINAFIETGFLEATRPLARAFLESILTGENTGLEFILYAFDVAKKAGFHHLEAVPDEIWLGAEASFPWRFDL
ncbi:MAG: metallophosphoesterase family protein, partial [Chloroflexota bacterium]|nr:metallophosphoesterase family protein [Chloroflexota bacterium]